MTSPRLLGTERIGPHHQLNRPRTALRFAPRNDSRQRYPRSMAPVRLAGAEVTEAFWAKLAGDYCGCARRGTGLVGSRFPERIAQITNAAEVLPCVVYRHPEPALPPADIPS
jgi:hypothetical protein